MAKENRMWSLLRSVKDLMDHRNILVYRLSLFTKIQQIHLYSLHLGFSAVFTGSPSSCADRKLLALVYNKDPHDFVYPCSGMSVRDVCSSCRLVFNHNEELKTPARLNAE